MKEVVKVCKKHGELTMEEVRQNGGYLRCKKCHCDFSKKERLTKPDFHEKKKEREAKYRKEVPEIIKAQRLRHIKKIGKDFYLIKCLKSYGLTLDKYHEMVKQQNNTCAICCKKETRKDPKHDRVCRLVVDHSHKTGKVRALLCHSCNTGIGKFKEDIEIMLNAINYLEAHN